jgi:hypothetical protein
MKRAVMTRALAAGMLAGGGAMAAAQGVGALAQVQTGEWQLHEVGAGPAGRSLCVSDPRRLLQVQHGTAACTFRTITSAANAATVRYVCPGAGNGTTELTVESKSIVRLHTQGVQRGAPFDVTYEARFAGPCRTGLAER